MRNIGRRKILIGSFLVLIIVILWQAVCSLKMIDTFLVPAPSDILNTAIMMIKTGELFKHICLTLKRLFLGFFIGGTLGLLAGSCCGVSKKMSNFFEPLIYLLYPVPKFVLLPFVILVFGTGIISKVIFIAAGAFFPLVINTISGIDYIDKNFLEISKHYGAKGLRLYTRVIFPGSLPYIFTGLRISIGLTMTYVILVEFLTATDGIGAVMWISLQTLRLDKLFLGAIIVSSLNIFFVGLIIYMENLLIPWNRTSDIPD